MRIFLMVVVVVAIAVFAASISKRRRPSAVAIGRVPEYLPIRIMTDNEIEFFGRLLRALPDHYVFPQVAMAALIKPSRSFIENKQAYWSMNQKRVDFAIYNKQIDLVCIVELDDVMHNACRDAVRDANTGSAGIKTLRWESRSKPNELEIRRQIITLRYA
jgi:hypothetical protein